MKTRAIAPRIRVVEISQSGQVYSCGCGRSVPVERADHAGWKRQLMTGCLVWVCDACRETIPRLRA